ncbi:MAG: tail fiber domain-containing protein [Saprospiraceae bacterium]|nr:tail fiber domain-containing protein [Saprospiraceae bacterium]
MRVIILCFLWSTLQAHSFDAAYSINGCAFKAAGGCTGALLQLVSGSGDNWIRFAEVSGQSDVLKGIMGLTFGTGVRNLLVKNYNQGAGDLVILEGGKGGKFWMYPDGKLYANNLGNIGDHKDMQWNSTTGEIGWDSSTRRPKIQISTLSDDWSKILQTRPVKFTRPASPDHWEYGYIAEEMDSVGVTNLVGYDAEGLPDDVKYEKMVLYLTEMTKIHHQMIAEQEKEISELKETIGILSSSSHRVAIPDLVNHATIG